MIKTIVKYFIYILFFIYILTVSLPKTNLYYLALEKLSLHKIVLSSAKTVETQLSFTIDNALVYYDDINIMKIDKIFFSTFIYKTELQFTNIHTNEVLKNFLPETINEIKLTYDIVNLLKININASFQEGKAFGYINLLENKIVMYLDVPHSFLNKYTEMTEKFKKEGSYYVYEVKY